jgi:dihydropteroate synthase
MINSLSESITLSINLKGNLLSLKTPLVMGILNITNDSFYKKSRFIGNDNIIEVAQQMFDAGATIIDIGAASSRPGAKLIEAEKEIETLLPVLENLVKHFPEAFFSIDTYHSKTAKYAVDAGAAMINDISSGSIDKEMFSVIAALNVPYVMMHMQGIPETMQDAPSYSNVVKETLNYFIEKVSLARQLGIKDVIIDPGFGFGKALNHNYLLLQQLHLFNIFQVPILCGLSRKSFINKIIETNADSALNGTTVLNTIALLNGANILRVHDVIEAQQAVRLVQYYLTTKGE